MGKQVTWAIADGTKVSHPAGAIHIDELNSSGQRTGYNFRGDARDFTLSPSEEESEFFSSVTADRGLIARATFKRKIAVGFMLDEVNQANLADFLLGTRWDYTQVATAVVAEAIASSAPGIMKGNSYQVAKAPVNTTPAVVVKAGATTYVVNTDYIFDYDSGMLYIVPTGAIAAAATNLTIDYTPIAVTGGAPQRRVAIGNAPTPVVAMRFTPDPSSGPLQDYEIWRVSLSPDGDINVIADDWAGMKFKGLILADPVHALDTPPTPYGYAKIR